MVIVTTAKGLQRKAKRFKSTFSKLSAKGVSIRISAPDINNGSKEINDIKNHVKMRKNPKTNARFIIIDDKEVLFMIADDSGIHENYDTAIWVNTPYFTKALSSMAQGSLL